jgi:hypothetical protein
MGTMWGCGFARIARAVVLSSLVFCWGTPSSEAGEVFYQKDGWTGVVLTSDQKAIGCAARTSLEQVSLFDRSPSQMSLALAQLRDLRWVVAFSKPDGFQPNMRWKMELLVDGNSAHRGTAVVDQSGFAILQPPLPDRAISAIAGGNQLEIVTVLGRFTYSLHGSADAIDAAKCIAALNSPPPPPAPPDVRLLTVAESTEMLDKILNAAGLRNYRFDPPKGDGGWVTFTLADGTFGRFAAALGSGTNADNYTALVIGKQSSYCKGDFMSGKQSIPSVDGSVVRMVTTTCQQGEVALVTETTIIRHGNGLLMELSQISSLPVNSPKPSPGEIASSNRAALVNAALQVAGTQ